jgi:hypothetical protein
MRAALAAAAVAALAACSGSPGSTGSGAPSPAASSASPSPTPTSTLPADEQAAVDQATAAVVAYEQLQIDLRAEDAPLLNQLGTVAVDPQLTIDTQALTQDLGNGTTISSTGPAVLVSATPVSVTLAGEPPTVVLLACFDETAVTGTTGGKPVTGQRQESQYRVVRTAAVPAPGWAVAELLPPPGYDQPRPC